MTDSNAPGSYDLGNPTVQLREDAPEHAAPKDKANKAVVGTILTAIATGATAAATTLPDPYGAYVAGGVVILGTVASWFGIYITSNKRS